MRRHHEEFIVASSIVPALSLLVPFAGALWVRIKTAHKPRLAPRPEPKDGGDL